MYFSRKYPGSFSLVSVEIKTFFITKILYVSLIVILWKWTTLGTSPKHNNSEIEK